MWEEELTSKAYRQKIVTVLIRHKMPSHFKLGIKFKNRTDFDFVPIRIQVSYELNK